MINWLLTVIGEIPQDYYFLVVITACVLTIVVVVNVINLFFSPFSQFK